jgi:hypothetical protein
MENMNYYKKVMYFTFFLASCEDTELKDCAGVDGGNAICGCTDIVASNFDSLATFDDGSCEYLLNGISIKWLKTFQVSNNSYYDESWKVISTSDGGFVIAGASDYKGLLIKTDPAGEKEWHQTYENSTTLYSVIEISDGGYVATGYYECDDMDCYPDLYLLKTDSEGAVEWEISDGIEENNEWAKDVIETNDEHLVITGVWNDDGWNSKAFLRKYTKNGELVWHKTFSNSTANEGNALMENSDNELIFVGYSGTQHGSYNHYMVKTDSEGNQIWKKKAQSIGDALLHSICPTPSGGFIAAGFCNSFRSNYLIERNNSGGKVWEDCFIDETSHYGYYDITPTSDGGYFLIDELSYLVKIDANGDILYDVKLNHVNQSIMELDDGDIVMGGYGFREGNSGGPISLLRLNPSRINNKLK